MARITLHINGSAREVEVDPSTPLRYVLRNEFGLIAVEPVEVFGRLFD